MSLEAPFFSVVIPTYNRAELLREALASVLKQTFADFEVLVVDDGQPEEARALVASFGDSRVQHLVNDHAKGGAGTRNAGIFRARGAWVAFLDDDDVWLPEKLQKQHNQIQRGGPDLGLVYTGSLKMDFGADQTMSVFRPSKAGWLYEDLLYANHIGGFSTVAVKRDLLLELGGLDEAFPSRQDIELYLRVARRAEIAFVEAPLAYIRQDNPARITKSGARRVEGCRLFWEKYQGDISKSSRLTHNMASQLFLDGAYAGDWRALRDASPWMALGLFINFKRSLWTLRKVGGIMIGKNPLTRGVANRVAKEKRFM